ncbi:MAG: class I SAM-dependent rRNA methyltransferase [Xanthomonadales bacterium]|nr:class I SAM-dependent rRNA methyltransferase [Xanthomonadales bacterium]
MPRIRLRIERHVRHPWIFRRMLPRELPALPPGSLVAIEDRGGRPVGHGFFNARSQIALRVLSDDPAVPVDAEWFARRIAAAVALRREVLGLDRVGDAWRVVHAEGDGLSGLVVDRFGELLVVEYHAAGMWRHRAWIHAALERAFPGWRRIESADAGLAAREGFRPPPPAPLETVEIREHGLRFLVRPAGLHKTGFFADQRENRLLLSGLAGGRRMLDLCCNSGAFSVYALARGGAREAVGVDLDAEALELARRNARLNGVRARFVQADLFPWLRDAIANGERFELVVLDPPKLTRERERREEALRKYLDMNRLAMQVLAPGGLLLSCSCTGLVGEGDFLEMLRRASAAAGRCLQVLHVGGAGPDHPFLAHVPESRYLKAVLGRLD